MSVISPSARRRPSRAGSVAALATILLLPMVALVSLAAPATASGGADPGLGGNVSVGGNRGTGGPTGGGEKEGASNPYSGSAGPRVAVPSNAYYDEGRGFFPSQPPGSIGCTGGSCTDGSRTYHYRGQCNGSTAWGPYIGWEWAISGYWYTGDHDYEDTAAGDDLATTKLEITSGGYGCIEPPRYQDRGPYACPWEATAEVMGRKPFTWQTLDSTTQATDFQRSAGYSGDDTYNPNLCDSEFTLPYSKSFSEWGRYELKMTGFTRSCMYRVYSTVNAQTGQKPRNYMHSCSAPIPAAWDNDRLQIFCANGANPNGYTKDWSGNWQFTTADCPAGEPGSLWGCFPQGGAPKGLSPKFAGVSNQGRFEVLDDGKDRPARWNQPDPWGVKKVFEETKKTRLLYDQGTPFRAGKKPWDNTQPFVVTPQVDVFTSGWDVRGTAANKSTWDLNFQGSGLKGDPWTAHPQWYFEALFPHTEVTIESITTGAGGTSYTVSTKTVYLREDATCEGQPIALDAHRARNQSIW